MDNQQEKKEKMSIVLLVILYLVIGFLIGTATIFIKIEPRPPYIHSVLFWPIVLVIIILYILGWLVYELEDWIERMGSK